TSSLKSPRRTATLHADAAAASAARRQASLDNVAAGGLGRTDSGRSESSTGSGSDTRLTALIGEWRAAQVEQARLARGTSSSAEAAAAAGPDSFVVRRRAAVRVRARELGRALDAVFAEATGGAGGRGLAATLVSALTSLGSSLARSTGGALDLARRRSARAHGKARSTLLSLPPSTGGGSRVGSEPDAAGIATVPEELAEAVTLAARALLDEVQDAAVEGCRVLRLAEPVPADTGDSADDWAVRLRELTESLSAALAQLLGPSAHTQRAADCPDPFSTPLHPVTKMDVSFLPLPAQALVERCFAATTALTSLVAAVDSFIDASDAAEVASGTRDDWTTVAVPGGTLDAFEVEDDIWSPHRGLSLELQPSVSKASDYATADDISSPFLSNPDLLAAATLAELTPPAARE
ncbi:hypothetical protein HK405_001277, partial [Cladochytrium tenue]